ncbi:MAG TPA: DUF2231 domain-containing protein [Acidobacteriaceae bacterium]|nr:DUF2231 domain-containing protein [Acidobacteriaceae bacterium]
MRIPCMFLVGGFCLAVATAAQAKPPFLDVLTETYKPYATALSSRSCANCHASDSDFQKRNPYGEQIFQAIRSAGSQTLTPAILHSVEAQASHPGDISNLEKIKQGLAPADPKPAGPGQAPAASSSITPVASRTAAPEKKPLLPPNAYHPAIVHFPIALFIGGLLLDLIGFRRNDPRLLIAGWYNLIMAAVSSFAAITTGIVAMLLMGIPLKGLILNHILLAVVGTIIMWVLVALRFRRHEKMSTALRIVYIVVAFAGLVLISYAGHLGGAFVYGE